MILQSLNNYYERLAGETDSGIAPFGFSEQKIAFAIVLYPDGALSHFEDVRVTEGKRSVNRPLIVPGQAKPSGSGINPCLLWDNPAYLLGFKLEDPKPDRTRICFEAFRAKHVALRSLIDCPEIAAVCHFLEAWKPEDAAKHPVLSEFATGFGVFQIANQRSYVHQLPAVLTYWKEELARTAREREGTMSCLVTGELAPPAFTHDPPIKGVRDAQSSGAKLVSFNCDAFTSYGKDQSLNAPVSEQAAFQYATALNHLLRPGSRQRILIGDSTAVFWSEKPTPVESIFSYLIDPAQVAEQAEDNGLNETIRNILSQISHGGQPSELGPQDTRFYLLGLAPNAARLSVRFWHVSRVGDLLCNIGDHYANLEIQRGPKDPEFPAIWQLLRETARESKDVSPLLGGALARSILARSPYPQALPLAVINRIRADHRISATRAAILKAFLIRNHKQTITMSLDTTKSDTAYLIGRLFAALEKTQEDALPSINATIRDRFYSSASATPGVVFPRLLRTYQHHLAKLQGGQKVNRERLVQEILGPIDAFPRHLNLEGQSLFALGYYHQRQSFFTKKELPPATDTEA